MMEEASRLLKVSFRAHGLESFIPRSLTPWGADFFGLSGTTLWKNSKPYQQEKVLEILCQNALNESYFIELAGMSYAGKMNLLAETLDEKSYFCMMASEEAMHFEMLKPWFPKTHHQPSSFAQLIGKIVDEGDRRSNLFLIQILLEGWGLSYYQSLAQAAKDPAIHKVFEKILLDESRHHAAGVIFFSQSRDNNNSFVKDALVDILEMVRVGPFTAASTLLQATGFGGDKKTIRQLLEEMRAIPQTQMKLDRLDKLISRFLPSELKDHCQKNHLFRCHSLEKMSEALLLG